jgi:hypothetical protein
MGEAIFGLVGVIVGGFITACSSYLLDRRREQADRQKERQSRATKLKTAARLIDEELARGQAAATIAFEDRHWWNPDEQLLTGAWQQYREFIAPELSQAAWHAVSIAIIAVHQLSGERANAVRLGLPGDIISDSLVATFGPPLTHIEAGRLALAPFTRDVPPLPPTP